MPHEECSGEARSGEARSGEAPSGDPRPASTSRRGFLAGAGAAAAALLLGRAASGQSGASAEPASVRARAGRVAPPFAISLAQWSLHRALQSGRLGPDDFPRIARHDFGIDAIEHVSVFLAGHVTSPPRLAALRRRADDLGVASLLIMVDGEGALGDGDPSARAAAVQAHRKWLDAAHALGCHSIRVNAYGSGAPDEHAAHAAESLRALAERGGGLNVIVENHGGLSSNGAWLADVMRRADHPAVGTLPDFGNFRIRDGEDYDRYLGVEQMLPWARAVSAKSYAFDAAGRETTIDYARMLKLVLAAGYHGHVGIEYEGDALAERQGIAATLALLKRLQAELA
jgi:L-ribulose-5-phosphate 3-epimerase